MCSVRTGGGSQRKLIKRRQHTFPPKHAILDDEEEQEIPDVEHKQHLCRRDEWFAICGVSSAVLAVAMFEGNARVFVSSLSNHNHAKYLTTCVANKRRSGPVTSRKRKGMAGHERTWSDMYDDARLLAMVPQTQPPKGCLMCWSSTTRSRQSRLSNGRQYEIVHKDEAFELVQPECCSHGFDKALLPIETAFVYVSSSAQRCGRSVIACTCGPHSLLLAWHSTRG